ncbi:MAG TPA: TonB family protein [Opitutaceae bacterium]|nr:TonB family protein [Opitutaceae bacterium]
MSTSLLSSPFVDEVPQPRGKARQPKRGQDVSVSLGSIGVLVAWSLCAAVSLCALVPAHRRVMASTPTKAAVKPVTLEVKLTDRAFAQDPQQSSAPPPPSAEALPSPDVPPMVAVAEPSPAIAFAVPVEGPVRVVPLAQAAHVSASDRNATNASGATSAKPQTLVFGQGEGVQPAPAYPPRAAKLFQEGTVLVRLTVDENGNVVSAAAEQPCVWPLLNEAAVRTVEQKWHFRPGALRVFDVSIHFRLKK